MKLGLYEVAFAVFVLWTLGTACYVAFTHSIVRAAFALLGSLFGVAALYALMRADFMAVIQVLIYVGGINILIIFGVMLTEHVGPMPIKAVSSNIALSGIIAAAIFLVLVIPLTMSEWPVLDSEAGPVTDGVGKMLLSKYLLPFEVASILLLAVLVGAVSLARKEVRDP